MLGADYMALQKIVSVDARVVLALIMARAMNDIMDTGATAGGQHLRDQFVRTVSSEDISDAKCCAAINKLLLFKYFQRLA